MTLQRAAGLALAVALLATPALAQERGGVVLEDLTAARIDDNDIKIEFTYQGSACEEVLPAVVGEETDGTLIAVFPTIATADVCTMQVVDIEVDQIIEGSNATSSVDVTLLAPDGTVLGKELARLD